MKEREGSTTVSRQARCENCGASGVDAYCPRCGQIRPRPLTVRGLYRGAANTLFDVDRGFFHTIGALTRKPGETCRGYVDGHRQPLTGPFKYCFIVVTIYAVTVNLLGIEFDLPGDFSFDERERRLFELLNSLMIYLLFFVLIPVAAIQRLMFRASGDSLGESYLFCLYVFGHLSWLSTLFALTGLLSIEGGLLAFLLVNIAFVAWAMKGFYAHLSMPPVLRAAALTVINFLIVNLVALTIGSIIVQLGWLEPLADALA